MTFALRLALKTCQVYHDSGDYNVTAFDFNLDKSAVNINPFKYAFYGYKKNPHVVTS